MLPSGLKLCLSDSTRVFCCPFPLSNFLAGRTGLGWNTGLAPELGGHSCQGTPSIRGPEDSCRQLLSSWRVFSHGNSFIVGLLLIIKVTNVHSQ